ncbi:MAG TPA: TetR/AcrR family transcriptional regulator [Pseudonocardiaceae bacterium]|jgi:AcrR family transcriptional regulator|nr:TetR/AcrR family transcriptional regulator [Pseudonocardiaceae bacterium]
MTAQAQSPDRPRSSVTRDRLLLAAAQLLDESPNKQETAGKRVSTRAICERAGVQAPTLYHHFGSKQGLLDAVVNYGFTQYVQSGQARSTEGDPVARIRDGWDDHVRFGLEHPSFYVLLYGQIQPGVPCTLTANAEAMLLDLFTEVARQGRLRVGPAHAARQFVAANSGVTLSLIAQPADAVDLTLSTGVRDALLAALVTDEPAGAAADSARTLAVALSAALAEEGASAGGLSPVERSMLGEWLDQVGSCRASDAPGPGAKRLLL